MSESGLKPPATVLMEEETYKFIESNFLLKYSINFWKRENIKEEFGFLLFNMCEGRQLLSL